LGALLTISTLQLVGAGHATGGSSGCVVARWLDQVQQLSAAVKQGRVTPRAWRRRMQRLTHDVSLAEILRIIDFESLAASLDSREEGEPLQRLVLPTPPGLGGFAFSAIVSRIRERFAVVPHGHHNMVSMHLILRGSVHLRQYDRLRDEPTHLVIRPMADRVCHPGDTTAISADRGNVHWFRGLTDSFALIIAAYDLDPVGSTARDFVDPLAGERQRDGSLRVPRVTADEAYRRYLTF